MNQFSQKFCQILALLNAILCFVFFAVGNPVHAAIFGASACTCVLASRLFIHMENLDKERCKLMQATRTNNHVLAEDEYEVPVDED